MEEKIWKILVALQDERMGKVKACKELLDLFSVSQRLLKRRYRTHYNKGFKDGQRNEANFEYSRKQLNGG